MEDGESMTLAALRAAQDALGIELTQQSLRLIHTAHRNTDDGARIDHIFRPTKWSGEPMNLEAHKIAELVWLSEKENAPDIAKYVDRALWEIAFGRAYAEYGW